MSVLYDVCAATKLPNNVFSQSSLLLSEKTYLTTICVTISLHDERYQYVVETIDETIFIHLRI